jgi:hypothetical protein
MSKNTDLARSYDLKAPIASPVFTGDLRAERLIAYGSGGMDTNVAVGSRALTSNTTGFYNTAIGRDALYHNNTGRFNSSFGTDSLCNKPDGSLNTDLSNCTGLGVNTKAGGNYATAIGYNASAPANCVALGTSSERTLVGGAVDNGTDRLQVNGNVKATTFKGIVERPASTGFGQRIEIGSRASGYNTTFRITPLTASNENYGVIIRAKYATWHYGIGMVDYIISCSQTETSVIQNLIGTHFGISPVLTITPSNVIIEGGGVTGSFDIAISVSANCNAQLEIDSIFSMPGGCSITQI